jgi:hypothetical protein
VRRILFDPHGLHEAMPGIEAAASWAELGRLVDGGRRE